MPRIQSVETRHVRGVETRCIQGAETRCVQGVETPCLRASRADRYHLAWHQPPWGRAGTPGALAHALYRVTRQSWSGPIARLPG